MFARDFNDLEILLRRVVGIFHDFRQRLFRHDALWNIPVRAEDDVFHRAAEERRSILI